MRKLLTSVALLAIISTPILTAQASTPAEDNTAIRDYFKKTLGADAPLEDFINGTYAIE